MKTLFKYWFVPIVLSVLAACEKEQAGQITDTPGKNTPEEVTPDPVTYDPAKYLLGFEANMEETKADMDDGTGKLSWSVGDQIKIISADGSQEATYEYNGTQFEYVGSPIARQDGLKAYFPADNFEWANGQVQFTMPAAFESLTGIQNPMAGLVPVDGGEEIDVSLKNLGGIYEVKLATAKAAGEGETVTAVELGNTSIPITGKAAVTVNESTGIPSVETLKGGLSVVMNLAESHTLTSTPKSVYFFLPETAENAFKGMYIKVIFGKGGTYAPYEKKTRKRDMTIERSHRWYMDFSVNGFFSGGDGSMNNPYRISTANDFKAIKGKMESIAPADGFVDANGTFFGSTDVYYQQTGTIDFASSDITENLIGTSSVPFKGTYDGAGNALRNVSITAAADNAGVFGYVDGGTIKKLTVSGSITSSKNNVGAIVGQMTDGTISGCTSSATINASSSARVGGIVGYMVSGTIGSSDGTPTSAAEGTAFAANRCANTGAVTGKQHVGGIVGQMGNGLVSICRNAANITADAYNAGGIVGYMQGGTIRFCYSKNAVTISGPYQIGGLAGYVATTNPIVIINSSSKSNVTSTGYDATSFGAVGGLVGCMAGNGKTCALANSVAWASDVINTSNANAYVGGIVGRIYGVSKKAVVRNCYSMHNGEASSSGCRVGIKIGDADLTFGDYCGGVFGYLENGEVDDCYWTKYNLVQRAGKETGTAGDKSVTNVQSMSNAAKNGTAQFATSVNYKNGRGKGTQYLYEHLRRGSFSTSDGSTLFSYTGFTTESSCAWGQKETFGVSSSNSNSKNAIPVAIGYLQKGDDGWWQQ